MPHRLRAVAFDLDPASLTSLREALPECDVEAVNGATAASLTPGWNPRAADLLVVQARAEVAETLSLCRFLADDSVLSADCCDEAADATERGGRRQDRARRAGAPLLLLVPAGQDRLVQRALEAGVDSCLVLPVHAKQVANMVAHAGQGNRPGRHTLNLDQAQAEDRWRDDGGQG
jgi:hypothetical protein